MGHALARWMEETEVLSSDFAANREVCPLLRFSDLLDTQKPSKDLQLHWLEAAAFASTPSMRSPGLPTWVFGPVLVVAWALALSTELRLMGWLSVCVGGTNGHTKTNSFPGAGQQGEWERDISVWERKCNMKAEERSASWLGQTGRSQKSSFMGQGYKPAERPQERSAALEGSRQLRTWWLVQSGHHAPLSSSQITGSL